MSNKLRDILALSAALTLAAGTASHATELTYAMGYAPGSVPVVAAENMAQYSAENGGPEIKVFPMSLLNIRETPPGIRDNVVDMGFQVHGIFQAEFPNSNLPAEFGMMATNATPPSNALWGPAAMSGAITEYIMLHCPDCISEMDAENQVYLSGQSSPSYSLHCSQEVTTLDDVKGKQMRTPSGYWARWVEAMGGVSVFMSANEAFNALSQGVVDCVVIHPADLITLQLIDVVKASTLGVPQGVYSAASAAAINKNVWGGLSVEDRQVLLEAATRMNADMTYAASMQAGSALEEARERGIAILEAAPDLKEATDTFITEVRSQVVTDYSEQYAVEGVDQKVDTIVGLIEKWVGLTENVATADDLFDIYMSEIVSKVDAANYGG